MAIEHLKRLSWVLLPGTLCTQLVFDGFLDALDIPLGRRSVVPLKYPTLSAYKADMTSLSDNAVICGFSLGAIVAAHHVDLVAASRIILFGLNPFADDPRKAQGRHELARDVVSEGGAAALASRLPPLNGPKTDSALETILSMADATASNIEAQTTLALTRPSALETLSRSRSPVMILTGSLDQMAPEAQGKAAAKAAPRSIYRQLPGLGHYALLEDPDACARTVQEMEAAL